MSEALIGLVGVLAGTLATGGVAWWADRERRKRAVYVGVMRCLDRLEKIRLQRDAGTPTDGELDRLGTDMDAYLEAIAAAPGGCRFKLHAGIYDGLRPILIQKQLELLDTRIAALRKASDR
jgi:hypothetical protein